MNIDDREELEIIRKALLSYHSYLFERIRKGEEELTDMFFKVGTLYDRIDNLLKGDSIMEKELKERLEKASQLIRHEMYSITTTKGKKQTKENVLELKDEKLAELMKLLEG